MKSRISCSKVATVYQQSVYLVPTQSFFAKAPWQGLDIEGPKQKCTCSPLTTKDEVIFGHLTRNMMFRNEVI